MLVYIGVLYVGLLCISLVSCTLISKHSEEGISEKRRNMFVLGWNSLGWITVC
jgi:hypothetical protein